MKKFLSIFLSVIMLISVLLVVPMSAIAEETTYHYSDIDFTESAYADGANAAADGTVVLTSDVDTTYGDAMKFTLLRSNAQRKNAKCVRLVDAAGTAAFYLQASTKYRITYDVKAVAAPDKFKVGLYFVTNDNITPGNKEPVSIHEYTTADLKNGYNSCVSAFEFTSSTETITRVLIGVYSSGGTDKVTSEIYLDNIVIAEQTTFTYNGIADTTGLTATAYANERYEDVLKPLEDENFVGWYLDAGFTKEAKGIINATAVTLYARMQAAEVNYYNNIDFTESGYEGTDHIIGYDTTANSNSLELVDDTDAIGGKAMKFIVLRTNPNFTKYLRLVDNNGSDYYSLKHNTKYRITYDIKHVSGPENFGVAVYLMKNSSNLSANAAPTAKLEYSASSLNATGYTSCTSAFEVTTPSSGIIRVLIGVYSKSSTDREIADIRLDNITIAEQTNITYKGTTEGEPATAWANQTYEEVLGEYTSKWYTDADKTTNPTGLINTDAVTLYAPYHGIKTPAQAGLFVHGDSSQNSTITGTTEGSAVYVENGVEYSAFRVFGEYIAPSVDEENTAPDYTKVIINAQGDVRDIVSRHVLLGFGTKQKEPTVDNNYKMSTASGDSLNKCWSKTYNGDGTWTIRYSLLLKKIPKAYRNVEFYTNSGIIYREGNNEVPLYTASLDSTISAQKIYDLTKGYTWYTE